MDTLLCLCAHSLSSFVRHWATAVESGIACPSGTTVGLNPVVTSVAKDSTGTLSKLAS